MSDFKPLKAVFFDRDGVLNIDNVFVFSPERFEMMPGAAQTIRTLNERGILALVVTNQSGIGRGIVTEDEYLAFETWVEGQFAAKGARIDRTYYCPHHPEHALGDYKIDCDCRKPKPGMICRAMAEFGLDPGEAIMIGDHERDIRAAEAAGVRALLFKGGRLDEFVRDLISLSGTRPAFPTL